MSHLPRPPALTSVLPCGLKLFGPCDTFKGPGGGQVANFRVYHVAKDGTLVSKLLTTHVDRLFDVAVSPAATDGKYPIAPPDQ